MISFTSQVIRKRIKHDFQSFNTIRWLFGREICNNDLSLDDAIEQQIRVKDDIDIFKESTERRRSVFKKQKSTNSWN